MKTEMQVLERLKATMVSQLNSYIETQGNIAPESIDASNIEIDFPDPDSMRKNSMLYIQPDNESLEALSMSSDIATMNASVFILCKGARSSALIHKVFGYYSALYRMLRSNQTLSGYIEGLMVTDMDYFPQVSASRTMTAIEVHLQMQWSKEF
jgi:hypothetical protein